MNKAQRLALAAAEAPILRNASEKTLSRKITLYDAETGEVTGSRLRSLSNCRLPTPILRRRPRCNRTKPRRRPSLIFRVPTGCPRNQLPQETAMKAPDLEGLKIPVSLVRFRDQAPTKADETTPASVVPSAHSASKDALRVPTGCPRFQDPRTPWGWRALAYARATLRGMRFGLLLCWYALFPSCLAGCGASGPLDIGFSGDDREYAHAVEAARQWNEGCGAELVHLHRGEGDVDLRGQDGPVDGVAARTYTEHWGPFGDVPLRIRYDAHDPGVLSNILAHEFGHALGVPHSTEDSVMREHVDHVRPVTADDCRQAAR